VQVPAVVKFRKLPVLAVSNFEKESGLEI